MADFRLFIVWLGSSAPLLSSRWWVEKQLTITQYEYKHVQHAYGWAFFSNKKFHECHEAITPFFFKQWGGTNKKKSGRQLDGRIWDDMPGSKLERAVGSPF